MPIRVRGARGRVPDFVGSGASARAGAVPKPPTTSGTTKFLREDGTWQVATASDTTLWALPDDITTILATSASTHYERHPDYPSIIRARAPTTWATIADAVASPPTTWSLANSGSADSAAASSGNLTLTHVNSGTTGLYSGTATAPYFHRSITKEPGGWAMIFRLQAVIDDASNRAACGIMGPAGTLIAQLDLFNDAGQRRLRYIVNNTTFANIITRTQAECAAGVWCCIAVQEDYSAVLAYNTANQSTEPTSGWVEALRVALSTTATTWIETISAIRETASGTAKPSITIPSYRTVALGSLGVGGVGLLSARTSALSTTGFQTTGETLTLLGSVSYGAARLPTVAVVRAMLGAAANKLPGDAATWKFGVVGGSSSSLSAPTTLQTAAALDLKQSGSDTAASASGHTHWAIFARAESSGGTQPGSLDLSQIRLRTAA